MKRMVSLLLCLVMVAGMALTVRASHEIDLGQTWDNAILAGGIYDLYVWVGDNADDYTYQWQVDLAFGKGHWSDLEDNANPYGYRGTQTYHMELITSMDDGAIIGTGWEDIPFRCVVTHKKTGTTKATPNMYMNIFSSSDLPEYLKKQGFGLYEPTVKGAAGLSTKDYISYTATAAAGTQLEIFCGCWRPNGEHLLRQSNFTENIEIWVTENGKTVKADNTVTYTPYTVGKNAVTVQFKLRHGLGIHDLGYYETKTVQLSTTEPTPVAYATAKYQISLLKERYNESQKLASIPKGALVKVSEISSGWYQVIFNGYVGYVASSSMNLEQNAPIIDHVDITIAEPLANNLPPTSCSVTPDSCIITYVDWIDKSDGHFMEPGERFKKGGTYQVVIWAAAKEGYTFKLDANDNMRATAIINKVLPAYTSRAYEQIIGKVMEIRYDFVNIPEDTGGTHTCKPRAVDRVEPTCTNIGHEAYYHCSCGKNYKDSAGNEPVNLTTWGILPAKGHTPSGWRITQTVHYKACTTCGEFLVEEDHRGGTTSCIQKATCSVCDYTYGTAGSNHRWGSAYNYRDASGHARVCADCKGHDVVVPHTPGPAATETESQLCKDCGYIIEPARDHVHKLTKVPQVTATCTQPGNVEYYVCDGCADCFADAKATQKLQETTLGIDPMGHTLSDSMYFDADYHWQVCVICGEDVEETKMLHDIVVNACATCGYEPAAGEPESTEPQKETSPKPDKDDSDEEDDSDSKPGKDKPQKTGSGAPDSLLIAVLIGVTSFSVAITATVIILKKKGGQSNA